MNAVSLFAGMEVGRIAFDKLGVAFDNFYSSEIEPAAIETVKDNYQDITHLGDVTKWREWSIDWSKVDLIIGGSPCQSFSFAGKQYGTKARLDGKEFIVSSREMYIEAKAKGAEFLGESYLFWEFVLIVDHARSKNPSVKFLLENVIMAKHYIDMITDALGAKPVTIDAKYFTAHSRPRLFWCNWELTYSLPEQKTLKEVLGYNAIGCSRRARYINGKGGKTYQKLEVRKDGLANCMTTVTKNCKLIVDDVERNITVDEGCIFQGVPLGYFRNTKKTQALKMLGNGWNVYVIVYILSQLLNELEANRSN